MSGSTVHKSCFEFSKFRFIANEYENKHLFFIPQHVSWVLEFQRGVIYTQPLNCKYNSKLQLDMWLCIPGISRILEFRRGVIYTQPSNCKYNSKLQLDMWLWMWLWLCDCVYPEFPGCACWNIAWTNRFLIGRRNNGEWKDVSNFIDCNFQTVLAFLFYNVVINLLQWLRPKI